MITQERPRAIAREVRADLEAISQIKLGLLIPSFSQGDRVRKSIFYDYEIDDLDVVKNIWTPVEEGFPYWAIHHHFNSGLDTEEKRAEYLEQRTIELFGEIVAPVGEKKVVPFSKLVSEGVGACVAKSIAAQIFLQDHRESFYVDGFMLDEEGNSTERHAFNISFNPKKGPLLTDVTNPTFVDGEWKPYIVPINGVSRDKSLNIFELNQHSTDKRIYGVIN